MINVTALLTAEGFAPRASFAPFGIAMEIGDAIAATIERPIAKAKFIAEAAEVLATLDYKPFEKIDQGKLIGLLEDASNARSTPCGSVELWDCLVLEAFSYIVDDVIAQEAKESQ